MLVYSIRNLVKSFNELQDALQDSHSTSYMTAEELVKYAEAKSSIMMEISYLCSNVGICTRYSDNHLTIVNKED